MSPENIQKKDYNLQEFQEKAKLINEIDGSYQQDLLLPLFVDMYLTPSFYYNHPGEWRKGFEHLLKHINVRGYGTSKTERSVGLLVNVFEKEEEIGLNGDVQIIKQGNIIRDEQRDIYDKSMQIFYRHLESESSLADKVGEVLDSYGEGGLGL